MPQIDEQHILLGGSRIVGLMSVDGGAIRGEGHSARPQLVVPLKIEMSTAPAEAMLAVCAIRAILSTDQRPSPRTAFGDPSTEALIDGFPARSLPSGHPDHTVELHFALKREEIESLERHRHSTGMDVLRLYVGVEPIVVGLQTFGQIRPALNSGTVPWDQQLGLVSQVFPFWDARVSPISVAIEQSHWIRDVLPGLGYDSTRLVELNFPPPLPDHPAATAQFDKAKRALDERRYVDCLSECRGLLNMWERQLGATKTNHVAQLVSQQRDWSSDDPRNRLLDSIWKEVGDAVDTAHHPERHPHRQEFGHADARLVLLLTAILSEYVAP